jgi:hypothetical protein
MNFRRGPQMQIRHGEMSGVMMGAGLAAATGTVALLDGGVRPGEQVWWHRDCHEGIRMSVHRGPASSGWRCRDERDV